MVIDLFAFQFSISRFALIGMSLWALALYIMLSPLADWITEQLTRWFNNAERSLYFSQVEFETTRPVREAINGFYASLMSIIPFIALGIGCYLLIALTLGRGGSVSGGMLACLAGSMVELGRRTSHSSF